MKGRGSKEKRWFRWNPSRHARIPEGDLGRMQTPWIGEGRWLDGNGAVSDCIMNPESFISKHMKTTLALSIIKNIKNIDIIDVANGSYDLKSSLPLILNHIPKRDYDTIDEVIDFISDELDDAIEKKIEASTKWKNSPILTEAQLRMDFWKEVYEISTLHFNGVTIG